MDDLSIFLPLSKGLMLEDSDDKKTEFVEGQTRTKHKLRGVASTTSLDRDNEIVSKECLAKMANSIKLKRLPIFGNHEHGWDNMLGYAYDANVVNDSLVMDIETAFVETNYKAHQLVSGLEAGLPFSLSIGGKVKGAHPDKLKGKAINVIDDIEFLETSVVGIGANPDAFITLNNVSKIFKGEEKMEDVNKSSGQAGINSYGKLGETTPMSMCPNCKMPGEQRGAQDNTNIYFCQHCGKQFSVEGEKREGAVSTPTNNPPSPNTPRVGEEPRLAIEGRKSLELKGDKMGEDVLKASKEAEVSKEAPAEDEDYKKFKSFYAKLMKELEGVSGTPGSANADPKSTISHQGYGGAASPVHAKSVKEYESMQKAFVENTGAEGIAKEAPLTADVSFESLKKAYVLGGKR